jgi:hypothetical protein
MRRMIGSLSAVALAALAAAQTPTDPFEVCAQKTDATDRLACFDREMQRRHATGAAPAASATRSTPAASAAPPAATAAAAPAAAARAVEAPPAQQSAPTVKGNAASHADENVGLSGEALRKKQREQGVAEEKPKPIVSQVTRAISHPDHRYTFFLDNGQVWEQAESRPGLFVDAHETVTISPGVLGAFFMETSRHQNFRVRRID